jgi:uncharacterized membrane protein YccC
MGCCDDPTEPVKVSRADWVRLQEQYGNLLRDLLTDDPEKLMLKQLQTCTPYLRELAALNAHYPSVRKKAIELLDQNSQAVLKQLIDKEGQNELGQLALQRLQDSEKKPGLLSKLMHRE